MKRLGLLLIGLIVLSQFGLTAQNTDFVIGEKLKAFSAKTEQGKKWKSKKVVGKKNLVVYFYPAAMTGGCTKQACAYRDDKLVLDRLNAVVIGVSGDTPESLALFKKAHDLNFTLLSDPNGEIAKTFGVPVKQAEKSIVRTIAGVEYTLTRSATTARWTFVIDKEGKLIYKSTQVNAAEDSKAVIAALKNN